MCINTCTQVPAEAAEDGRAPGLGVTDLMSVRRTKLWSPTRTVSALSSPLHTELIFFCVLTFFIKNGEGSTQLSGHQNEFIQVEVLAPPTVGQALASSHKSVCTLEICC